jgi:hypothetical protein
MTIGTTRQVRSLPDYPHAVKCVLGRRSRVAIPAHRGRQLVVVRDFGDIGVAGQTWEIGVRSFRQLVSPTHRDVALLPVVAEHAVGVGDGAP